MENDFIEEMRWRGQLHQVTDEAGVRKHIAGCVRHAYAGFDPTADSLTIGNLVTVMALKRWQLAGHRPYILLGGGTGYIGDPSGKTAERSLLTKEQIEANVARIRRIFEPVFDFGGGESGAVILDNVEWLGALGYIELLRGVGKHFSVNAMIQKDSVRARLEGREQGISYTEFSYMILQAYDFLHLYREHGVTVQLGGSDQWGNIVGGCDMVRRMGGEGRTADAGEAFGVTWPLITKADGGKFGKTETGAVWLTPERTSPYAFYQFWLNTADADIGKYLRTFTLLPREEVEALETAHVAAPSAREAQRRLARHMTGLIHGDAESTKAEAAAKALFEGEVASLDERTFEEALASAPSTQHARATLEGEGVALLDLIVTTGLAASRREAKEFLSGGSVTINGRKAGVDDRARTSDLLHGRMIALRRGKKNWHLTRWG